MTTGTPFENGIRSEVIDVLNENIVTTRPAYYLPNANRNLVGGLGGFINGKPLICGGNCDSCGDAGTNSINTCFILGQNDEIMNLITMNNFRHHSSSIVINEKVRYFCNGKKKLEKPCMVKSDWYLYIHLIIRYIIFEIPIS